MFQLYQNMHIKAFQTETIYEFDGYLDFVSVFYVCIMYIDLIT